MHTNLLVGDNAMDAKMTSMMLQRAGFIFRPIADGQAYAAGYVTYLRKSSDQHRFLTIIQAMSDLSLTSAENVLIGASALHRSAKREQ